MKSNGENMWSKTLKKYANPKLRSNYNKFKFIYFHWAIFIIFTMPVYVLLNNKLIIIISQNKAKQTIPH